MSDNTTHQSGGPAAETTIINPNLSTSDNSKLRAEPEELVTLKHAAAHFQCAASSLKNNIKTGNLPATQDNPKAAYMVRLSDVERFLRVTPGIASVFHPRAGDAASEASKNVPKTEKVEQAPIATAAAPKVVDTPPAPEAGIPIPPSVDEQTPSPSPNEGANAESAAKTGKRRRNRRRGKGGDKGLGKPASEGSGSHPLFLKTLQGATPQERLRVIACLNELAGMVASA